MKKTTKNNLKIIGIIVFALVLYFGFYFVLIANGANDGKAELNGESKFDVIVNERVDGQRIYKIEDKDTTCRYVLVNGNGIVLDAVQSKTCKEKMNQ